MIFPGQTISLKEGEQIEDIIREVLLQGDEADQSLLDDLLLSEDLLPPPAPHSSVLSPISPTIRFGHNFESSLKMHQDQYAAFLQQSDSSGSDLAAEMVSSEQEDHHSFIPTMNMQLGQTQEDPDRTSQINLFQQKQSSEASLKQQFLCELDLKFPRLYCHSRYDIFAFEQNVVTNWFRAEKVDLNSTAAAKTFLSAQKWTIVAIHDKLLVFIGEVCRSPIEYCPKPNEPIVCFEVCPNNRYLLLGFQREIIIYRVKPKGMLEFKDQLSDLKLNSLREARFLWTDDSVSLYFLDGQHRLGVVNIMQKLFLLKETTCSQLAHNLGKLQASCSVQKGQRVWLALASNKKIVVFGIKPLVSVADSIEYDEESSDISILWRKTNQLQLVVGRNELVTLYRFNESSQELTEHLNFRNHYSVSRIFLVSEIHLLLCSISNIAVIAIPLISSSFSLQDSIQSEEGITFMSSEPGVSILQADFNSILFSSYSRVDPKRRVLMNGKLRNLRQYVQQELIKGNLRQALSLVLQVAKGSNYSFCFTYDSENLEGIIHKCIQYCINSLKLTKSVGLNEFRFGWLIELCVETQRQSWLWDQIYPKIVAAGQKQALYTALQVPIARGRIRMAPELVLEQAMKFYLTSGNGALAERLFLAHASKLSLPKDFLKLLSTAGRFLPLMTYYTNEAYNDDCDFYTPFLTLFLQFSEAKDSSLKNKLAMSCFLFLKKCFKLQAFPSGKLAERHYERVAELFTNLLNPLYIKKLAEHNMELLFEAMLSVFDSAPLLSEIGSSRSLKEISPETKDLSIWSLILNKVRSSLESRNQPILIAEFEAIWISLTNCFTSVEHLSQLLLVLLSNKFSSYRIKGPTVRLSIPSLKDKLVSMLAPHLKTKKDRSIMNRLISFEDKDISCQLHRFQGQYRLALEKSFAHSNSQNLITIIQDITEQIKALQQPARSSKLLEASSFLKDKIAQLFRLNPLKALDIFEEYGFTDVTLSKLINRSMAPCRLEFLSALLQKYAYRQFDSKNQYALEHLALIFELPEKKMQTYMDRFNYPLDQAIRLCEAKGNYRAKAMFEERSGLIHQAFRSYEKLIKQVLMKTTSSEQRRCAKIDKYVRHCLEICKKVDEDAKGASNSVWIRIITLINGLTSKKKYKATIKVELERLLQQALHEMLENVPTQRLIDFFTGTGDSFFELSPSKMRAVFTRIVQHSLCDLLVLRHCRFATYSDISELRAPLFSMTINALVVGEACAICECPLQESEKCISYRCGHTLHAACCDSGFCFACLLSSDETQFWNCLFGLKTKDGRKRKHNAIKDQPKAEQIRSVVMVSRSQATYDRRRHKLKMYDFQELKLTENLLDSWTNQSLKL